METHILGVFFLVRGIKNRPRAVNETFREAMQCAPENNIKEFITKSTVAKAEERAIPVGISRGTVVTCIPPSMNLDINKKQEKER